MKKATKLYFIAILPDAKTSQELTSFKQDFADRFESSKALRIMPHITLKIPFRNATDEHDELIRWFENLSLNQPAFIVELNGFGAFKRKQIIYVKPVENPNLKNLQAKLIRSIKEKYPGKADQDDESFSPHMTIAYRDLSKHNFNEAWKEYENRNYRATFEVREICLLEHDSSWKVIAVNKL